MDGDTELLIRRPKAGDCYRAKRDVPCGGDDVCKEGDLAIITEERDDGRIGWVTAEMISERSERISDPDEFVRDWQWEPDADGALKAKVDEAMVGITEMDALSTSARAEIGAVDPHLVVGGGVSEQALVPVVADIAKMRGQIGKVRNDVAKMSVDLKKRHAVLKGWMSLQRKRVESILKAQMDALSAKMGDLNTFIKKAEEAIWTINLYLGKDEQIVQIKKGKPAPKDTKISVRQRVLFADEECAVAADEGGIDHMSIEKFDEWLAVPANRMQVLPEPKGVVAFKPRRRKRDYGNSNSPDAAWVNAAHEKANKKTYFLMANGENLYRICTELEVTGTLIPTEDEVTDLFFETKRDYDTGEQRREPIYPGDKKYMAAMDAANDLKKHYLRILLFLQGLVDRTVVFAPLPAPRLNLLDRRVYNDHFNFITDAEKLLTDGRISFEDWLYDINGKLDVGHRILGAFHSWSNGLRQYNMERHGGNERLSPPRAAMPEDLALYTIEGREQGLWFFRYERKGETIWRRSTRWERNESGEAKRRASCRVSPTDDFILNYDEAKVEDMEFYLQDRTNRQSYAEMFPLLKKAIEMKHLEVKEEKPFKDLLMRKISEAHGAASDASVQELISWWKLKNRTHRALLSDDAKAFRMIVAEYGRRLAQEKSFDQGEAEQLVTYLRSLPGSDEILLVAYNRDGEYVILRASGKEDVYVNEEVVAWPGGGSKPRFTREVHEWQVVERKRLLTWKVIYQSERWARWKVDARTSDYLTDDERRGVVTSVRDAVIKKVAERVEWRHSGKGDKPKVQGILCVKLVPRSETGVEKIFFYVWRNIAAVPQHVLTGKWQSPEVEKVEVTWEKKKGVVKPIIDYSTGTYDLTHLSRKVTEWRPWNDHYNKGEVYEQDEDLIRRFDVDVLFYRKASDKMEVWKDMVSDVVSQAQEAMSAIIVEREKVKFLAEYEHEELWEEHLKTARIERAGRSHTLWSAVASLVERRVFDVEEKDAVVYLMTILEGRTFADLFAEAGRLGWKPKKKGDDDDSDDTVTGDEASVPMDARVLFDERARSSFMREEESEGV